MDMPAIAVDPNGRMPRSISYQSDRTARGDVLFLGTIVALVYECGPTKYEVVDSFEEYVQVLSGKLILVDANGHTQEVAEGESIVVPKGFSGTWEMLGDPFRELVVAETTGWAASISTAEEAGQLTDG